MKQRMRTIKQGLAQQRRIVLLVLALALFTSTLFALRHSLAQNSAVPKRPASKTPARVRAQGPTNNFQPRLSGRCRIRLRHALRLCQLSFPG